MPDILDKAMESYFKYAQKFVIEPLDWDDFFKAMPPNKVNSPRAEFIKFQGYVESRGLTWIDDYWGTFVPPPEGHMN
jgi:hypothetical protein